MSDSIHIIPIVIFTTSIIMAACSIAILYPRERIYQAVHVLRYGVPCDFETEWQRLIADEGRDDG